MSSALAAELAAQIESANLELIQLVRGCSEEQWRTLCNDEGDHRPVAVIAHHVAHGHRYSLEWLETALTGEDVDVTLGEIDVENAQHAATYHDVERPETARLLEETCRPLVERVGGLSDQQLAGTALHRGAGREMTVEAFARLGHRHVAGHLATIRRTLGLDQPA
jgi:hypothetical protein